jgi:glycerol-3-phosphate dehydrogenase (NAD(P)+)
MADGAAAATIAMPDQNLAAGCLSSAPPFRLSHDCAEIAGALKNVFAIAAGMADGAGAGYNTKAMVITRAVREMRRLGEALGGEPLTFSGLAGMGDLIVTCTSPLSRNRHVGEELGRGKSIGEVLADMKQVAEGVKAAPVVGEAGGRGRQTC